LKGDFDGVTANCLPCVAFSAQLTIPFSTRNFLPKATWLSYPRTLLSSLCPIEDKIESCQFNTFEVIEVESQAVLNTFTEHDFQDACKKGRSIGNGL
jgi:hypothetical protein